jgi:hypothetical protein
MTPRPKRSAAFAKGGTTKMFKPQAAGLDKPGNTGKDQTAAPGAKRAMGGPARAGRSVSVPAAAGRTGKRT